MNEGKKRRLTRIFKEDNRTVIVPMDHGVTIGPCTLPPTSTPAQTVSPSPSQAVQPTSSAPTATYLAIGAAVIIIAVAAVALILKKRK
jgi:DhnA family fructose-bisphosphate aldolase class Ia